MADREDFATAVGALIKVNRKEVIDQLSGENAAELLSSRLAFGTGDITVGIASDSTSDGAADWVRLWEAHLAEKYPHLRIENNQWVNADGAYGPTTIVQEGTGEPAFSGEVLHDTFTRSSGLETPDSGGPWIVVGGDQVVFTGAGVYATGGASLQFDVGAKDHTTTITFDLDSTGTGTVQRTNLYHGASNGARLLLYTNEGGLTSLYGYSTPSGGEGTVQQFVQRLDTAVNVPVNAPAGPVTVTLDSSIQVQTVTVEYNGNTWSSSWTITEEAYAAKASVAVLGLGPEGHTVDEVTLSVADRPATWQVLRVFSGTMGGGTLQYQIDNWDEMFGDEVITPGTPETSTPTVLTDTFARSGEVAGSTTNTGEAWSGSSSWVADGSAARATGSGGVFVNAPGISSASATVEAITTPPESAQTIRLGIRTAGSTVHGIYLSVAVSHLGGITCAPYVNTATGGYRTLGSSMFNPQPQVATATPQSFDVSISLDGLTVTATAGDLTSTGTITQAELDELGEHLELQAASTGTGAHFGVSNVAADYVVVTPGTSPVYGDPLDVMIVAHGHNYQRRGGDEYIPILEGFLDFVKARRPSTLPLLCSQNPQFPPTANPYAHAHRQAAVRAYAKRHRIGYAPVFEHFAAQPDGGRSWVLPDGVHPTTPPTPTPTPGYGSSEWGKALADAVTA